MDEFAVRTTQDYVDRLTAIYREEVLLRNGVDVIVTDCPLAMMVTYSELYEVPTVEAIRQMVMAHEEVYPALHILLPRSGIYNPAGRYQDEKAAIDLDRRIAATVETMFPDHYVVRGYDELWQLVQKELGLVIYR